jgi:GNAT superfamily N-acetyltransferase
VTASVPHGATCGDIHFEPYRAAMLPGMLDVWNAASGGTFPLRDPVFRQNAATSPHFDPAGCQAAVGRDGRVVGFSVAKVAREPIGAQGLMSDRGWISLIAVHPEAQRRHLGSALLRFAEEYLRGRGRTTAVLGGDPDHFLPGVPAGTPAAAFFHSCGYRMHGEAYDLWLPLRGYQTPPRVQAALEAARPEIEVRPLAWGEEDAVTAFLAEAFPGRWRYTVERFLRLGGDITDIMAVVRGDAVAGFAHLFHPGSRWIGPSLAWTSATSRAGGLGPMGVASSMRGRGLGLALVDRSIVRLRGLGLEEMFIDWTILLDFYGHLGFVPVRRYSHGEKAL